MFVPLFGHGVFYLFCFIEKCYYRSNRYVYFSEFESSAIPPHFCPNSWSCYRVKTKDLFAAMTSTPGWLWVRIWAHDTFFWKRCNRSLALWLMTRRWFNYVLNDAKTELVFETFWLFNIVKMLFIKSANMERIFVIVSSNVNRLFFRWRVFNSS